MAFDQRTLKKKMQHCPGKGIPAKGSWVVGDLELPRRGKKRQYRLGYACVRWEYMGFGVFQGLNKGD